MAAYLVLMQQVHDIDRYRNGYLPGLRPFLRKHGAEVLVPGFGAESAEGEPPDSTVVLGFAGAVTAWGLLNDSDDRPVRDRFQQHVAGTGSGCAQVHVGRVTAGLAA